MKIVYFVSTLIVLQILTVEVWAYGSSSSSKSCTKPIFSDFNPADKAVVAKQAEISFFVAQISNPKSVVVTVKQQELNLQATSQNGGFLFVGKLPADIAPGMARINVAAESAGQCKANAGWLVNISE